MDAPAFTVELSSNRAAYERLREQIRSAGPGQYAAIAQGRLIALAGTFDEGLAAVQRLRPIPKHFFADEEPAFDVIDDFEQSA
ncbi:MAG TPA: hypothetical protein PLF81_29770 [Candidatus Anammoximicrobium sp.]|nr:hypothetical protein [Candidatus Anammoximicrobium sp.]